MPGTLENWRGLGPSPIVASTARYSAPGLVRRSFRNLRLAAAICLCVMISPGVTGAFAGSLALSPAASTPERSDTDFKSERAAGNALAKAKVTGAVIEAQLPKRIDLSKIDNGYDPERDPDVPIYTDVTLPGTTPELIDPSGRRYALITLYDVEPPLEDFESAESGVDRGADFRDPSNLVKSAYSNYVSPVFTDDREHAPVPGHPIGHFYVKVQVPGHPAILTGMTTIERADDELVDITLARHLGLGGVLLTPEPGRLNSSAHVMHELGLRQRRLTVVDGINYRREHGRNVGPVLSIEDGNVVFARFKLPVANVEDAVQVFREYIARGLHKRFGSLLSRPNRGTGAGCSAFAMMWLKAAGVIPVIDEAEIDRYLSAGTGRPFWTAFYHRMNFPWDHIGCDERVGLSGPPQAARYTIYDDLFHGLSTKRIIAASEGLAAKIRADSGTVASTLFSFGVLTPLRDLVLFAKRKDPSDEGSYAWASPGEGLPVGFWDNERFAGWVKSQWQSQAARALPAGQSIARVREGRFRGVEIDEMNARRMSGDFFAVADRLAQRRADLVKRGVTARSCRDVFLKLGLQ